MQELQTDGLLRGMKQAFLKIYEDETTDQNIINRFSNISIIHPWFQPTLIPLHRVY